MNNISNINNDLEYETDNTHDESQDESQDNTINVATQNIDIPMPNRLLGMLLGGALNNVIQPQMI